MSGDRSGPVIEHLRTLFSVGAIGALSDGCLLDLFLTRREEAAFQALVERHGPMVFRVCRQVLGDSHDAQDASQAVFLVLAKRGGAIQYRVSLASWLHGVAFRTAAKARTAAARRRMHERRGGELRAGAAGDRGPAESRSSPELHEELNRLPEKYRVPIVLCHLEGMTREVAAQQLGWPVGTVQSRLARGQERLRARLVRRGVTLSAGLVVGGIGNRAPAEMTSAWVEATVRAATRLAAGESVAAVATAPVVTITRRTIKAMWLTNVSKWAAVGFALGAVAMGGITLVPQQPEAAKAAALGPGRSSGGDRDAVMPEGGLTEGLTTPAVSASLEDLLEAAMRANGGRATGSTWKAGGGDAGASPPPATVELPADGRVIDLEGRPVAGARVWVLAVRRSAAADLTPFLTTVATTRRADDLWRAWHDLADGTPEVRPPAIPPPATSDADGRFRLEGVGRERAILALIEGQAIEAKPVIILTRPGPTVRVKDLDGFGGLAVYGASFEHVAAPSRAIEGVVRDHKTGEPLSGISIRAASTRDFAGLVGYVRSTSDAQGRFRLIGVAEGTKDRLTALPPADRPYLATSEEVELNRGEGPAVIDLHLEKGVWVRGRVTDAASGKPVAADVEYHAFRDNTNLGPDPRFEITGGRTANDGSYRLLALTGRGIVAARSRDPRYVRGVGLGAIFKGQNVQEMQVATYPNFGNVGEVNAVAEIDPADGVETVSRDLVLDTGKTRKGTVLGPDRKPVSGWTANGLTPGRFDDPPSLSPEFSVTGLAPDRARRLVFRHDARRLVGLLSVPDDGAGPLAVMLGPWATLTGRILDDDGEPRTDVEILLDHEDYPMHARGGLPRQPSRFEIDKEGRFRIEALAPGVTYDLNIISKVGVIGYVAKGLSVKAGETKDLGGLKVIDTTR